MAKKLVTPMIAMLLTAASLTTMPALAEGYFETHVKAVLDGFQTRRWSDSNSDGYNTEITASGCTNAVHGSPGKVTFTLRRELDFRPDANLGERYVNGCYKSWERGVWAPRPLAATTPPSGLIHAITCLLNG